MALNNLGNDFFTLLGGPNDEAALRHLLKEEWNRRCNKPGDVCLPHFVRLIVANSVSDLGIESALLP